MRPCGLLSTARVPALARALSLDLVLALGRALALALDVALNLLRALALALPLALRLALPPVFALASAFFCSPDVPTWTPGGANIDSRSRPWSRHGRGPARIWSFYFPLTNAETPSEARSADE